MLPFSRVEVRCVGRMLEAGEFTSVFAFVCVRCRDCGTLTVHLMGCDEHRVLKVDRLVQGVCVTSRALLLCTSTVRLRECGCPGCAAV